MSAFPRLYGKDIDANGGTERYRMNGFSLKINAQYALAHGTYWMYYGILSSLSSVFLLSRGFSNSAIGIIIATGNIIALVGQPLLGDFADHTKRITSFNLMRLMGVLLFCLTGALFFLRTSSLLQAAIYVLAFALMMILQPFVNAMNHKLEQTGVHVNFGVCRSVGSLFYSALMFLMGILIVRYGENLIPAVGMGALALFLPVMTVAIRIFDRAMRQRRGLRAERTEEAASSLTEERIDLREFARRHRTFIWMCGGIFGIYCVNAIVNIYMAQIVTAIHGDSGDVSRMFSLLAFLEIIALVSFDKLCAKFGDGRLLKFASLMFPLWILLITLSGNVRMMYAAQCAEPLAYAIFLPAMVRYIDENMSSGEAVKAHASFTAMISAATVAVSFIGGILIDTAGVRALLFVGIATGVSGAAIIHFVLNKEARGAVPQPR